MISLKGIRLRYFALAIAIIAIIAGVYFTFIQSNGFEKTTAEIVSIVELPKDFEEDQTEYDVTIKYAVNGTEYTEKLGSYSPTYQVGKTINVLYNPSNPAEVHNSLGFGIYVLIAGIVIFVVVLASIIIGRIKLKKLKETEDVGKDTVYPAPALGKERELYFLTDLGTPKYGHRIEDANRNVLFEAKMTKYSLTSPFGFNFIDYVHDVTKAHLVGHEESSEWNSLLIDDHHTIQFDGEDIWKHLKRNGIRVESVLGGGSGKLVGVNYRIYRDDAELARVESTSQYVHEEDAEAHRIASAVPVKGFFRIWTKEQNLELLFVTLLAFARTEASDASGGTRKTLFNTLKGEEDI
ncbi:MAG: DUF3592 domain-containing protein [Clostridia bacterium]|nr:DUF3592 domain-containing protein [Clostridia bacterium]